MTVRKLSGDNIIIADGLLEATRKGCFSFPLMDRSVIPGKQSLREPNHELGRNRCPKHCPHQMTRLGSNLHSQVHNLLGVGTFLLLLF